MLAKRNVLFEFLKDFSGMILVFSGIFLFIIGLLYTSPLGSLSNALGLFFGMLLVDIGLIIHFELFKAKLRSKEGVANILIGLAPLLIVSGVIYALFAAPDWSHAYILPQTKIGYLPQTGWVTVLAPLVRIYLWLAVPLAIVGVVLLVTGFLLRIYDAIY